MVRPTGLTSGGYSIAIAAVFLGLALSGCLGGGADVKTSCGGGGDAMAANLSGYGAEAAASQTEISRASLDDDDQGGNQLVLGTLLPLSGSLSAFGGDMENATVLAREQINSAGGVNGQDIRLEHEDSRSSPSEAPSAFLNLVNRGVAGVVGAASSGVTGSILDLAVDNNVVVVSPASTSPDLTTKRDNQGFFYRVPPNDALQGKVMADLVYDDGCMTAGIIALNNDYGVGFGDVFRDTFESMGGTVTNYVKFEEGGTTFTSQAEQVSSGSPDAIVYIGYPPEGSQIVKELFQKGALADSVLFFSEGVNDQKFVDQVGQTSGGDWVLTGLRGTTPQSPESNATSSFKEAYEERFGDEPGLFAAESYDAVFALALAAAHSGEMTGSGIKSSIRTVWNSPGTSYDGSQASEALSDASEGMDIDYAGAANDFDWDEKGDPAEGIYAYWQVTEDGKIELTREGIRPE